MDNGSNRLGRSMEALLNEGGRVVDIPLNKIKRNKKQPRTKFKDSDTKTLAESIRRYGLLQPIVLKEKAGEKGLEYQVVAGERRMRAASEAGLSVIPAVVREVNERDELEIALVENLQRVDLSVIDRARAYKRLIEDFGLTQQQVAEEVGRGRASIANTIRILELPSKAIEAIEEGLITEGHGRAILSTRDSEKREKMVEKVIRENLSVRDTEKLASKKAGLQGHRPEDRGTNTEKENREAEQDDDAIRILTEALGTKVEILRRVVGGRLMLHFYGEDDLRDLVDILTQKT